jgi:type II secretory pathway component PulK
MTNKRQSGVAMVFVLALTLVLGMLILQFALTARSQIAQAKTLLDRSRADFQAYSLENELLFSLLTESRTVDRVIDDTGDPQWNFEGRAFSFRGYPVRVQDMSGLFAMPGPGAPTKDFEFLLETIGSDVESARAAGKGMYTAQTTPAKFPLQTFSEVAAVTGLPERVISRLEDVASFYPATIFNPLTAPREVLEARYGRDIAGYLLRQRQERRLNEVDVQRITGQDLDLLTSLLVGPGFRLEVEAQAGEVRLVKRSVWTVYPSAEQNPLLLWSRHGVDPVVN